MMRPERRPRFSALEAERLAAEHFGLSTVASALPSDRDQNFHLRPTKSKSESHSFVLKIFHADETDRFIEAQRMALEHLDAASPPIFARPQSVNARPQFVNSRSRSIFARPLPTVSGAHHAMVASTTGARHHVWLTPFLPGQAVATVAEPSSALLHDIGRHLGHMDRALEGFAHPATKRTFAWSAEAAPKLITSRLDQVSPDRRQLLQTVLADFQRYTAPHRSRLPRSVIHNDVNDHNLLVEGDAVTAILDFGDMLESFTVCDLAHGCAYLVLDKANPRDIAHVVAAGYQAERLLTPAERESLFDFVCLRLALSVTMSAYQRRLEPDNEYLSVSERPAWALLEQAVGSITWRRAFDDAVSAAGTLAEGDA